MKSFSVDFDLRPQYHRRNANWITIGTTIRFPAPEQRPARERTGHL